MYAAHQKKAPVTDQKGHYSNVVLNVTSPDSKVTDTHITSRFTYGSNEIKEVGHTLNVTPKSHNYTFRIKKKVPKMGMMLVGLGGNNGSTAVAGILANSKHISWRTKAGIMRPNYFGSLTQATTVKIGSCDRQDVNIPFNRILPMVEVNDLAVGGWDINNMNLADAMERAQVLHPDLQQKLRGHMKHIVPLPAPYYPDFIAGNQEERANNVLLPSGTKQQHLDHLRQDIRDFKAKNGLDEVSVLWTANTERFVDTRAGLNDTADNLLAAIKNNEPEVSPSQIFAVASILEGSMYINGSPQNTLTDGVIDLAKRHNVFIAGDDFKSGQTKMKSVLVDFMVSAGIKPEAIVSYNHLGNNDGYNLSVPKTFRSKEISKSNVVDDMVASNKLLFPDEASHPDHVVVIKYVPFVRDSKRAMDEYTSSIFMNGVQTIVMHNTCEDSLLATPLIYDLVVLGELMSRIEYKTDEMTDFEGFHNVLSILSYMLKAPVVPKGTPVINALMKQQRQITNLLMAVAGLKIDTDMRLEYTTKLTSML